ncbi:OLC1v1032678C1 [Oldenlandia corymbosa var. corymbosa]|uniref:OLC1v1032678C1 n=1 Tax=Oldenlandia corymbosa var. corymbosa TaxID=529605 RepID=A0AAV1CMZ5_OLDCO|nr:OLC1v1032678C1 [Oldenlandia corymbosa var. corymbosa]
MEKALTKVESIKAGSFWLTKKAKQEFSNISEDFSTFSNTVEEKAKWVFNKLKGKPLKSLPVLLQEYNLPPGLFPINATSYEYDESKSKLTVYLPAACEVSFKDSSTIRYAPRVKGILMRGKLTGIEGMKTKVLVWAKVTTVGVEGHKSDKVSFTAGVKKSRPKDAYDVPQVAIRIKEF